MMGTPDQLMDMSIVPPLWWRESAGGPVARRRRHPALRIESRFSSSFVRRSSARIGSWPTRRPLKGWRARSSSERRRRGPRERNRPWASDLQRLGRLPTCGRSPRSAQIPSPISSPERRMATGPGSTSASRRAGLRPNRWTTKRSAKVVMALPWIPGHAVRGTAQGRAIR